MNGVDSLHKLEHFQQFTQKSWIFKKNHILLQVTGFGYNGSTDSSMLNFNELQGFKIANNEWWNQSGRMWHHASACSEENLIMFCCRLVQLGWTGTGDGPAWLAESEHRKFVGESPSPTSHQTSFCITDFTPGESWNRRSCCEQDSSVFR